MRNPTFKVEASGCHIWQGAKLNDGYGLIHHGGKSRRAHRFYWEQARGPIPPGMFLCHKCDNRLCVNPDHLFIGTQVDNMRDMIAKGRRNPLAGPGEANGQAKLSNTQVAAIRAFNWRGVLSRKAIGDLFGVSESLIRVVINGKQRKKM